MSPMAEGRVLRCCALCLGMCPFSCRGTAEWPLGHGRLGQHGCGHLCARLWGHKCCCPRTRATSHCVCPVGLHHCLLPGPQVTSPHWCRPWTQVSPPRGAWEATSHPTPVTVQRGPQSQSLLHSDRRGCRAGLPWYPGDIARLQRKRPPWPPSWRTQGQALAGLGPARPQRVRPAFCLSWRGRQEVPGATRRSLVYKTNLT